MWIFKKEPPPKPKLPAWVNIAAPVIFAVILGLTGVVYNSIAEDLKQKVDNKTLQLMIEKQDIKFEALINALKSHNESKVIQSSPQETLSRKQIDYYFSLTPEQKIKLKKADPKYSVLP
jgi:negative regulator of sigma E activity